VPPQDRSEVVVNRMRPPDHDPHQFGRDCVGQLAEAAPSLRFHPDKTGTASARILFKATVAA